MLNLSNIQGNILRGYASFPNAHFLFLSIESASDARALIQHLLDTHAVTPAQWDKKPEQTLNIALSFEGLRALGLPAESLASFPAEFVDGMRQRASQLGDVDGSSPQWWDDPWRTRRVHMLFMMYGRTQPALDAQCQKILQMLPTGVQELKPSQPAGLLTVDGKLTRREHFGFLDGLSNPDVEGVPSDAAPGRPQDIGNPDAGGGFRKIPIGEFILGYPGEGGELAPLPLPHILSHDGTFLVFRKLEQKVLSFRNYLDSQAGAFGRTLRGGLPAGVTAKALLAAKMMGRWQKDGSSLIDYPEGPACADPDNSFAYAGDPAGARCPLGAHIRRANPRDALGFDGKTMSRHRLIRRGIAYGNYLEQDKQDEERRGIIFIAFNSGFDQFEFVQENWINFGDDFEQSNDTDPIAGNRRTGETNAGQMTIPGDEVTGRRPFILFDIPRFVETRGGDYFFVPSLTGLSVLAAGRIEVT